jgi:hypothetical protein
MNLITKNYNGIAIDFNTEESIYINATQIAKHFNKDVKDWKESKHTIEYIKALVEDIKENNPVRGISENGGIFDVFHEATKEKLIIINQGGNDKNNQGTWIHKKLIINFARWLSPKFAVWCDSVIEELLTNRGKVETQAELHLKCVNNAIEILKVNEASKILMLEKAYRSLRVDTSFLPNYTEEDITHSLTELLAKHNVDMSARKFNQLLIQNGIVEVKTRKSTKGIKTYKALTNKGLKYGKNLINPKNQRETQPHYFDNTFEELLKLVLN